MAGQLGVREGLEFTANIHTDGPWLILWHPQVGMGKIPLTGDQLSSEQADRLGRRKFSMLAKEQMSKGRYYRLSSSI